MAKFDLKIGPLTETIEFIENDEEVTKLAYEAQKGCLSSQEKLVTAFLPLMVKLASKRNVNNDHEKFNEFLSVCCEGFIDAIKTFDHSKGSYVTFARRYAGWYMYMYIKESGSPVTMSKANLRNRAKVLQAKSNLEEAGIPVTEDKISEYSGLSSEMVRNMLHLGTMNVQSLDTPISGQEHGVTHKDMLLDETPGPEEILLERDSFAFEYSSLQLALAALKPREERVVRLRFAIGKNQEVKTLEEISKEMGVSRERIRQIESKALEKIKKTIEKQTNKVGP